MEEYKYVIKVGYNKYLQFIDNIEDYWLVNNKKLAKVLSEEWYEKRVETLDKLIDLGLTIPHFESA
ncbi:hypothetical protein [Clostridium botulinum]|uniref:hypothetical protein n=1 Tax=Clostridium botulinum TaxID=1491 RepID=UPI001E6259F8|nr:hypothetical protein [Clostridium botulinum]MCD3329284.1 hypothetical protein [Clostridium botulinum D/C]MCD3335174.1 hypothetical protein [Clostridium botulinum D/C]MCD3343851.1 hypothetical protein [Clostridium botulinum D/C]MCD3352420.1 hypothetical protein [Clostridium botulinum D/C]